MYDAKLIQPQRMSVAENNPLIILYLSGILAEKRYSTIQHHKAPHHLNHICVLLPPFKYNLFSTDADLN